MPLSKIARASITRLLLAAPFFCAGAQAHWLTGFYESANGIEPVDRIPWGAYTHVVHFAARPDGAGGLLPPRGGEREIASLLRARPAGKQALLCVADNGENPDAFAESTSPRLIRAFVDSIVRSVAANGYDGVDLDWEINIDSRQYLRLLAMLREALPHKTLAVDMNNSPEAVETAATGYNYIDQLNAMCYDMDSPGNGFSWYNAALFQNDNVRVMTCDWRVKPFLRAGVPPSRIGIGLPFYGRRWEGVTKALAGGPFSASTILYNQLVADTLRWQERYQFYDDSHKSNYLSIAPLNEFISYTGVRGMRDAAAWIEESGFGGAMTYSLHYEYLENRKGDARYPLSTALHAALSSAHRERQAAENAPDRISSFGLAAGGRTAAYCAAGATACLLLAATLRAAARRKDF